MHTETDRRIAANVARLADSRQIPLKVLANTSGISYGRLHDAIKGRKSLVAPEVEALARELGVPTSTLLLDIA